jgi:hypothetical protein
MVRLSPLEEGKGVTCQPAKCDYYKSAGFAWEEVQGSATDAELVTGIKQLRTE